MESSMKNDVTNSEIDTLEKVLYDFENDWEVSQKERAVKWRLSFFISFIITLIISIFLPALWWTGIAVIAYFAGSLYSLLRQNAKTSEQIIEHQQQLKLVRLLRKFEASPYSEK